jgi:hypothetical protein
MKRIVALAAVLADFFIAAAPRPVSADTLVNDVSHCLDVLELPDTRSMLALAERCLLGRGVDVDRGVAWYWLKRAQQDGEDIAAVSTMPLQSLLYELSEAERWSLRYLAHLNNDLDLSDMALPDPFAPLSRDVPKPLTDTEAETFATQFRGLSRLENNDAFNELERDLVARTAGIRMIGNVSIDGQVRPLGMSDEEFSRRKCNYRAAKQRMPSEAHHKNEPVEFKRSTALASFFRPDARRFIEEVMRSGRVCPNEESRSYARALAWATDLKTVPNETLDQLAQKHDEKSIDSGNDHDLEAAGHRLLSTTIRVFMRRRTVEE